MEIGVSEAAKQWNLSRQYIYRKIKSGELSRLSNGNIDTSELLRVFGEPKKEAVSAVDSQQTVISDSQLQQENILLRNVCRTITKSQDRLANVLNLFLRFLFICNSE